MVNLVPGFIWHPIDVSGRARRVKGRGAVGHVAVSNSANLVPSGPPSTRAADWHWYNPKVGPGIQYIDLDLQCWASGAGNKTLAAFESQGGMGTAAQVNAEPWNANQIENAARFYAHLAQTEGAPLQVMPNSLPGSRGLAGHRLGIDPWRVAGGEVWSSSRGKLCPGDAKMAQLPVIVARANEIVHGSPNPEDDMPTAAEIAEAVWNRQIGGVKSLAGNPVGPAPAAAWVQWLATVVEPTVVRNAVWMTPLDESGSAQDGQPWASSRLADIDVKMAQITDAVSKVVAASVDPVALAKALLADDAVVAKLGDAIAAGLAARVHS